MMWTLPSTSAAMMTVEEVGIEDLSLQFDYHSTASQSCTAATSSTF